MSTAAEDFKTVLEADSAFMTLLGTGRIFVNYMPDGEGVPDDVVVLQDFIGRPTEYVTGKKYERPSLDVQVRTINQARGRLLVQAAHDLIDGQANVTINSVRYLMVACMYGPYYMKKDDNERHHFRSNFMLQRQISN